MRNAICFLIYAGVICVFTSCKKSSTKTDQNTDDPKNNSSKLFGNWKLTAQVSDLPYDWNSDGTAETDIYGSLSSCGKDVGYYFVAGGTGDVKLPCEPSRQMTWKVVNNSDSIAFTIKSNNGQTFVDFGRVKIIEITPVKLEVKYLRGVNGGQQVIPVTNTYKKQ